MIHCYLWEKECTNKLMISRVQIISMNRYIWLLAGKWTVSAWDHYKSLEIFCLRESLQKIKIIISWLQDTHSLNPIQKVDDDFVNCRLSQTKCLYNEKLNKKWLLVKNICSPNYHIIDLRQSSDLKKLHFITKLISCWIWQPFTELVALKKY